MSQRSTILNSARELIATAEQLDVAYTGGVLLQEIDVEYFIDALFTNVRDKFGSAIEIQHFEQLINGVRVQVLPIERANAFYVFCKSRFNLVDSITPAELAVNEFVIKFKLRPPVRFLASVFTILFLLFLAGCCQLIIWNISPEFDGVARILSVFA